MNGAIVALSVLVVLGLFPVRAHGADDVPKFKITGSHNSSLALLVPPDTTAAQLKALILAFRKARQERRLETLIPATTPHGSAGPYGIVVVYVYTEPAWATSEVLARCSGAKFGSSSDVECSRRIRAHYYYGGGYSEEGSVGYAEGTRVLTKPYEKLF